MLYDVVWPVALLSKIQSTMDTHAARQWIINYAGKKGDDDLLIQYLNTLFLRLLTFLSFFLITILQRPAIA